MKMICYSAISTVVFLGVLLFAPLIYAGITMTLIYCGVIKAWEWTKEG